MECFNPVIKNEKLNKYLFFKKIILKWIFERKHQFFCESTIFCFLLTDPFISHSPSPTHVLSKQHVANFNHNQIVPLTFFALFFELTIKTFFCTVFFPLPRSQRARKLIKTIFHQNKRQTRKKLKTDFKRSLESIQQYLGRISVVLRHGTASVNQQQLVQAQQVAMEQKNCWSLVRVAVPLAWWLHSLQI